MLGLRKLFGAGPYANSGISESTGEIFPKSEPWESGVHNVPDSLGDPSTDVDIKIASGAMREGDSCPSGNGVTTWNGNKFINGFGSTQYVEYDYDEIRQRSEDLCLTNPYARGIVRRLVTNVINEGLRPEITPESSILKQDQKVLREWARQKETIFRLWAKNAEYCDVAKTSTFGQMQAQIYREALIGGDCLVLWRYDEHTKAPRLKIIPGSKVVDPSGDEISAAEARGNKVIMGVELDSDNVQIAYFILQDDGKTKRISALGEESGRRVAKLVYAFDRRVNSVRGEPLLAIILQSLREIDRFRDSAQRKASVSSNLAVYLEKTDAVGNATPGNFGGATRRRTMSKTQNGDDIDIVSSDMMPGYMVDLPEGLKPVPFPTTGTDVNFGPFEQSIISAIAWACECPPEIIMLAFSSNYSASSAAINEFNQFLRKERAFFVPQVCQPTLVELLYGQALSGDEFSDIIIETDNNEADWIKRSAICSATWMGIIRPAADILKQSKGLQNLIDVYGLSHKEVAAMSSNDPFDYIVEQRIPENEAIAKSLEPFIELFKKHGDSAKPFVDSILSKYGFSNINQQQNVETVVEEVEEELTEVK